MKTLVSPDKIVSRGCMSLMCEGEPLDGGLCLRHLLEMLRALK